MDPNYDYKELGWEMITFDEPNLGYDFNILCFWKTKKGLVFSAKSKGNSSSFPFNEYKGETEVEIEQKLERVGSFSQAKAIFAAWNHYYNVMTYLSSTDTASRFEQLESWFK